MYRKVGMSVAYKSFEFSIKDAEELLGHFDAINFNPPPSNAEVLKRAGLVMALTAWETYVEDRLVEEMKKRLLVVSGSYIGEFVDRKLKQELKSFHNPNAEKTRRLFNEYLNIDVTLGWQWSNFDSEKVQKALNQWIAKRGDAVHRSKPVSAGQTAPHLIRRDELEKAIRFIKELVKATDTYISNNV
jgi:hypothetical protein